MSPSSPVSSSGALGSAQLVTERIEVLARLTEVPGEITRAYGTPSLIKALSLVEDWLVEAGLEVRTDAIGNVIGRLGPRDAPTVLLGSHVDSVRDAGRYDGPLGVLAALAAIERVADERADWPLAVELVCFADEEGLRYRSSYLASRAFAGLLEAGELDLEAEDGLMLVEAVRAMGGDPDRLDGARRNPSDLVGYVEVHIEQGPVLQEEDLPVGVVTAIAGQSRGFVDFVGTAGHAGNTPPHLRRDALLAAAEFVLAAEEAMAATPGLVATVGKIDNQPNVGNVIPGTTVVSYDVRHQDDKRKEDAVGRLRERAGEIAERRGLEMRWRPLQDHEAVPMAPELRSKLVDAVGRAGIRPLELASGAGHDAVSLAEITSVGMLFVRCRDGVSHHPDEFVADADIAVVVDVLSNLLRAIASEQAPDG